MLSMVIKKTKNQIFMSISSLRNATFSICNKIEFDSHAMHSADIWVR